MSPRQAWQALDLLCQSGIGVEPIAPDVCAVVRDLVGAQAVALFWLDAQGHPQGFFHEDSPAQVQDLFLTEYPRLFVGEHEVNVTALAQGRGRPIGQLLQPDKRYFRSNTYNLLVRASGHHHCLDMRVDHDGQARVVVLAFRTQACPAFSDESARTLQRVGPYLQRALLQAQSPLSWMVREQKQGFLVADTDGRRITLVDPTAQTLLAHLGLRDTAMAAKQGVHAVPTFVSHLCQTLASASQVQDDIQAQLPCAGGALLVRASRLMAPGQHQHTQTLIELRKVVPDQLALARRVISLRLSPLQRQIVMRAAQGLERATCQQALGVSSEALKKHLRQVYAETGTRDWPSLTQAMAGGSP